MKRNKKPFSLALALALALALEMIMMLMLALVFGRGPAALLLSFLASGGFLDRAASGAKDEIKNVSEVMLAEMKREGMKREGMKKEKKEKFQGKGKVVRKTYRSFFFLFFHVFIEK